MLFIIKSIKDEKKGKNKKKTAMKIGIKSCLSIDLLVSVTRRAVCNHPTIRRNYQYSEQERLV